MSETAATIPVNVVIAGRSYRIRVVPEDEAFVRHAVNRVNDQIAELRNTYAGKDDQDFVAMCLLIHAVDKQGGNIAEWMKEQVHLVNSRLDAILERKD